LCVIAQVLLIVDSYQPVNCIVARIYSGTDVPTRLLESYPDILTPLMCLLSH